MVGLCWYCFKLVPELLNETKMLCTYWTIYFFQYSSDLWCPSGFHSCPNFVHDTYAARCGYIFKKYYISFHLYADDTQTYIYFKPGDTNALAKLWVCTDKLKLWLMSDFLTLNEGKIEVILFEPNDALSFNS